MNSQPIKQTLWKFSACLALFVTAAASAAEPLVNRTVPHENGDVPLIEHVVNEHGLSEKHVRAAFAYFDKNHAKIQNQKYLTLIDYRLPNTQPRLWVIDLRTGEVEKRLVAHGSGKNKRANPQDIPLYFSNTPESNEGSLGFFITGAEYPSPKFGRALNLHGQEKINDKAYDRRIVFHGADYVNEDKGVVGRSWGCPAVDNRHANRLIDQLKDGSLLYIVQSPP